MIKLLSRLLVCIHFRGTRWACFSTTLGAACHELGHVFDLGHAPMGMMARGFDDIYKVFTSARPAARPAAATLSGSTLKSNSSSLSSKSRKTATVLQVLCSVSSPPPPPPQKMDSDEREEAKAKQTQWLSERNERNERNERLGDLLF